MFFRWGVGVVALRCALLRVVGRCGGVRAPRRALRAAAAPAARAVRRRAASRAFDWLLR